MIRRAMPVLCLLIAGCQSYTPAPLASAPSTLAPVDMAALSVAAGRIERPYLKPVAIDLARPLDGNAVATLVVLNSPDLKAARAKAGVAEAQIFAARLLPDPTLNIGASKVLSGPDPLADLVGALALDLNALRTRGVRVAQAHAAADQVRLDLAWSEWQAAGSARLQAVRIVALTQALALAQASRESARSLLDRNLRAAGRGDIAGDAVQTARLAATDAESKLQIAAGDLNTARFELTRLLGLPPATELRLAPAAEDAPPPTAAALFEIAQENRTDLRALRAGYASQEAAYRKAILDQFPTLALTLTANRDTSGNMIVGPTVDFTMRCGIATGAASPSSGRPASSFAPNMRRGCSRRAPKSPPPSAGSASRERSAKPSCGTCRTSSVTQRAARRLRHAAISRNPLPMPPGKHGATSVASLSRQTRRSPSRTSRSNFLPERCGRRGRDDEILDRRAAGVARRVLGQRRDRYRRRHAGRAGNARAGDTGCRA